ncbi:hypothetical protein NKDENANG_03670 [Candidatus Entotheonellaceae bacterium PAL068K]
MAGLVQKFFKNFKRAFQAECLAHPSCPTLSAVAAPPECPATRRSAAQRDLDRQLRMG